MPMMSNLNQGQVPMQMQQGGSNGMYPSQPMSLSNGGMSTQQYFQGKPIMGQSVGMPTGFTPQSVGGMSQQQQQQQGINQNQQQINYGTQQGMGVNMGQSNMMQQQQQLQQMSQQGQMQMQQGQLQMSMQQGQQQMRPPPVAASKPANIPKPWHQPSDAQFRKSMNDSIVHLLEQKKPNAADWRAKLPQMAAKLEENLYFSANSLEEYVDVTSLKSRLQQLAVQMGGKQPHPGNPTPTGSVRNN